MRLQPRACGIGICHMKPVLAHNFPALSHNRTLKRKQPHHGLPSTVLDPYTTPLPLNLLPIFRLYRCKKHLTYIGFIYLRVQPETVITAPAHLFNSIKRSAHRYAASQLRAHRDPTCHTPQPHRKSSVETQAASHRDPQTGASPHTAE